MQKLTDKFLKVSLYTLFFILSTASPTYASNRPFYSGYFFYYGDLHSHSGYSNDGVGTPQQAYESAKANKNDFFSLTEHDEAFIDNPYLCLNGQDNSKVGTPQFICSEKIYIGTTQKWNSLKQIASEKNIEGKFIALYGYEWTHAGGHLNIFEASDFSRPPYSLEGLYNFIANHSNQNTLFVQFNHPTLGFDFRLPLNNPDPNSIFTYNSSIAPFATLVETNQFAPNYPKALKNGYKVGATGYGDGHSAFSAGTRRYGVIAPSLTKENIIKALKNKQTFGVLDGRQGSSYFPIALALKVNSQIMGSSIDFNGTINYEVFIKDELKNIDQVEIRYGGDYTSDYYLIATFSNLGKEKIITGNFSNFAFGMPSRAKFVYAVAKQKNASGTLQEVAWSSPVWIKYNPNINPTPSLPLPTPTSSISPTPPPPFNCQPTCYYGQSQCKSRISPISGYSCTLNYNCSGCNPQTGEWCWAYCSTTNLPPPTPTPTQTPTLVPSPTPSSQCQPTCFYGESQCKYRVTPIPGYSCTLNYNCPSCNKTTGEWCWAYCK